MIEGTSTAVTAWSLSLVYCHMCIHSVLYIYLAQHVLDKMWLNEQGEVRVAGFQGSE